MKKLKYSIIIIFSIIFISEITLRVFAYKKLRRFDHPQYIADAELGYKY